MIVDQQSIFLNFLSSLIPISAKNPKIYRQKTAEPVKQPSSKYIGARNVLKRDFFEREIEYKVIQLKSFYFHLYSLTNSLSTMTMKEMITIMKKINLAAEIASSSTELSLT